MKSQVASINKGFTLIEILVVIGLVALVLGIGAVTNVSFYTRELRASEQTTFVAVLEKARSRAMNNIYGSKHGLHIKPESYVLFYKFPYNDAEPTNEAIPRNPNITITSTDTHLTDNEVIFNQLSGETEDVGIFTMQDTSGKTKTVEIQENGLIIW